MNRFPTVFRSSTRAGCLLFAIIIFSFVNHALAQDPFNKVLTLTGKKTGARDLPQDNGAAGLYQRLLKLTTIASVLHIQAHPDDEHADVVTYLSRGKGYRSAILSLNRGESGANVLGPEAFDALGVLRTEEFLLAAAYYGLDDLYFTRLVDYGYSKRVAETYEKWGRENILREMVRVIRINRPLVVISRFHGSPRDGHGNHQAAGEMTPLAFLMAGDSLAFPELLKEGLRPWKPLKLYRGGIRIADKETFHVAVQTGVFSPWLGQSYKNFSLLGYSMHRSQVAGTRNEVMGPFTVYYERLQSRVPAPEKEQDFFDGMDTSIKGIYTITGETPGASGMDAVLESIESSVQAALQSFRMQDPAAVVPALTRGLAATRSAIRRSTNAPEAAFLLRVKEKQFEEAIHCALNIQLQATAVPEISKETRGFFEPLTTMGPAVPGQSFAVKVRMWNNSGHSIEPVQIYTATPKGWDVNSSGVVALDSNQQLEQWLIVTPADSASYTQPYFFRRSLHENVYQYSDRRFENLPFAHPDMEIAVSYHVYGERITIPYPVEIRQANLPYGYHRYQMPVAPVISVNLRPRNAVLPVTAGKKTIPVDVSILHNGKEPLQGTVSLQLPQGWTSVPAQQPISFLKTGEKSNHLFQVIAPSVSEKKYTLKAVAAVNGKQFSSGSALIHYRDLQQQRMYYPAETEVRGIAVRLVPGLKIGYVMGAGDEIPSALQQLGAQLHLLTAADLAAGQFAGFNAIVIGIRAYAVRPDLVTYNQSLLQYAKNGGHLIVLYQTPEFVPDQMAAFPAKLPGNAEEVSEENAPVRVLKPDHPVLHFPNKITAADFDNWVEQRGSKFFSEWDQAYVPIIGSHDTGQALQPGGWLMAKYGSGTYTYFAYSLHRQLPYGVSGAYRILANLVSYGMK